MRTVLILLRMFIMAMAVWPYMMVMLYAIIGDPVIPLVAVLQMLVAFMMGLHLAYALELYMRRKRNF